MVTPVEIVDVISETIPNFLVSFLTFFSLIFWFFFRNRQPLKYRGLVPLYVCLTTCPLNIISGVVQLLGVLQIIPYYWYYLPSQTLDVCYVSYVWIITLQMMRFILLQNIQSVQYSPVKTSAKSDEAKKARRRIAILKFFASPYPTFIIVIPVIAIYLPVNLTLAALRIVYYSDAKKLSLIGVIRIIVLVVMLIAPILSAAGIILYDLVRNRASLCPIFGFFIKKDRLLFRVDYIVGLVTCVVSVISLVLQQLHVFEGYLSVVILAIDIVRYTGIALVAGCINCCIFIILSSCYGCTYVSKQRKAIMQKRASVYQSTDIDEEMKLFLADPNAYDLFLEFTKAEYASENMECFTSIQEYKKIGSIGTPKRESSSPLLLKKGSALTSSFRSLAAVLSAGSSSPGSSPTPSSPGSSPCSSPSLTALAPNTAYYTKFDDLMHTYVYSDSLMQVNLPVKIRKEYEEIHRKVTELFGDGDMEEVNKLLENSKLMNSLEHHICLNLLDSFARFRNTADYAKVLSDLKAIKKGVESLE